MKVHYRWNDKLLQITRRRTLKFLSGLSLTAALPKLALAARTPSAMEGPFYPTPAMRFSDADNDLVKIKGVADKAKGDVIVLKGRILDKTGKPISGARVEIWQCDANGRYLHTGDPGDVARDQSFQGFGHVVTGSDGGYAFRTIKPVPYPGRAPHIHVKVFHDDQVLTTQFYIEGHELNAGDFLFQRMSETEQRSVGMSFINGADGTETNVDVLL